MSGHFFNPLKPTNLHEYEDLRFSFNRKVDSFIYKLWDCHWGQWRKNLPVPDTQYFMKLNDVGKLDFINIHKGMTGGRTYIQPTVKVDGILQEQPITYYQQLYSGGTQFFYDDKNRIIKYTTEEKYMDERTYFKEKQFFYDDENNAYVEAGSDKYEYNETGQLISIVHEPLNWPEDYGKTTFDYDDKRRIKKVLGYGYFYDDSDENNWRHHISDGIQLVFENQYHYNTLAGGELECICEITDLQNKTAQREITLFDKLGFKKYLKRYNSEGQLNNCITYYDFVYDEFSNWIKLTVRNEYYPTSDERHVREVQFVYQREIQYPVIL